MRTIEEFLPYLASLDVKLWLDAGDLRINAPKGVLTSELVAKLKQHKPEIIRFLRLVNGEDVTAEQEIPLVARTWKHPLSFAQQRLWLLHQLQEERSSNYNIANAVRIRGDLQINLLEQSFVELVRRQESLRLVFDWVDGRAIQRVDDSTMPVLRRLDLRGQARDLSKALAEEARAPFDLMRGPLLRLMLFQTGNQEHVLQVTCHHIISDIWSMGIMVAELAQFYEAAVEGRAPNLPDLPVQYIDYAQWLHDRLDQHVLDKQLEYWQLKLEDAPRLLELPTDRPRPSNPTHQGDSLAFRVGAETTRALNALSRSTGATLYMTLEAVLALLLSRYSGSKDISIGLPLANRERKELEPLIGFFVNTLVLRNNLSGNPSFKELVERVRQTAWEAFASQDVPFEQIVDSLDLQRDLSYSPLFQVMFAFQNIPKTAFSISGLDFEPVETGHHEAKFDLTLFLGEAEDGLDGMLEYSTELFNKETAQGLVRHLQVLLDEVAKDPESAIDAYPLMSTQERRHVVEILNQTARDYPDAFCLQELFSRQAARRGDAVAVSFSHEDGTRQELSYTELEQRANQLAHLLVAHGIGPESRVGLFLPRCPEMVVCLLAVLKAGGAYVPLDPDYPIRRLNFMVEDADLALIITSLEESVPDGFACQCLSIASLFSGLDEENTQAPATRTHPNNLAYVMYTSGSTGQPKGVAVCHRNVTRLVFGADYADFNENRTFLQLAPFSFDASTLEIWAPLLHGGRCALFPQESLTTQKLGQVLRAEKVDSLWLTSALFNLTVDEDPQVLASIEQLLVGGDALSAAHIRHAFEKLPATRLINGYGPTESTTFACCFPIEEKPEASAVSVPIGYPIGNTRVYVLDALLNPVAQGVPGELFIGGDGLARGYLNRPGLTAERFVPDPFHNEEGSSGRLYRTGDLVRYRDNALMFLSRMDHQVKLRGFRVEPGEVSAVLNRHEAVSEAVALVREERGEKRLVAFVKLLAGPDSFDKAALIGYLAESLPAHMIPTSLTVVETMPLSANGKVDRKALLNLGLEKPRTAIVAPRTPTEETLAQIWSEVLGLDSVGVHDNFFELGGDSILVIQLVSRARRANFHFSPKQLYQYQTIAGLLAVEGQACGIDAEQDLISGEAPLTPIQHWFFEGDQVNPHHFNQSLLFRVAEDLDPGHLSQALKRLVAHHDALRLRFAPGEYERQTFSSETEQGILTVADLDSGAASFQEAVTSAATALQSSLDLEQGPLIRVALLRPGERLDSSGCRLLILIHHLVVDGVSWRILLDDLQTLYRACAQHEPLKLPAKTTSFKSWACRLEEHANSESVTAELSYWSSLHVDATVSLPHISSGGNTFAESASLSISFGKSETDSLLRHAHGAFNTGIDDLLLTALAAAFEQWTDGADLVLDLESHGRDLFFDNVDLSRTVGWFTALYPVRIPTHGEDLSARIKSVKEALRQTPHRGLGYGLLRYLHDDAEIRNTMAKLPRAQVVFNYLGQLDTVLGEVSAFTPSDEPLGPLVCPSRNRDHLLVITAAVSDGCLNLNWVYPSKLMSAETIGDLSERFATKLRHLSAHCLQADVGGRTPSDFPLAGIDQATIDTVFDGGREVEDLYPLSPMQQGMLFHDVAEQGSGVYVNQISCEILGDLDVTSFIRAWSHMISRHHLMRTSFHWEGVTRPLQAVRHGSEPVWQQEDWSCLDDHETRLAALKDADRRRGFVLEQAPLLRFNLIKLPSRDGLVRRFFLWTHHHLLMDGWSLPIVFREVFACYRAYASDMNPDLIPIPPFRDYINWLESRDLATARDFWKATLDDYHSPAHPALEAPVASVEMGRGQHDILLTQDLTDRLSEFARGRKLTLNTLTQAAWAVLLGIYSGKTDVVFGATVSGRPADLPQVGSMVGLFINTVPVRVCLHGDETVVTLLSRLRDHHAERTDFEYVPLMRIGEWSAMAAGEQLFDSLFAFENYPAETGISGDHGPLEVRGVQVTEQTNFPLVVMGVPGRQLSLRINYDVRKFRETDMTRLLGHLQGLLAVIAARPETLLRDLFQLDASERERILVSWNNVIPDSPQPVDIAQMIAARAVESPEAMALELIADPEPQTSGARPFSTTLGPLTYAQLDQRSNTLAAILRQHGVGPDCFVGVCLARSTAWAWTMLSILKAGGAFVPLDPDYPRDRLSFMLEDARPGVLLTERCLEAVIPNHEGTTLFIEDLWSQCAEHCPPTPSPRAPSSAAYMIYTSGSSGKPKGVIISHAALAGHVAGQITQYELTAADRVLQFASYNFDTVFEQVFATLGAGAQLKIRGDVIWPTAVATDIFRDYGLTVTNLPTAYFQRLIRDWEEGLSSPEGLSIRLLQVGGEEMTREDLVVWERLSLDRICLRNCYGPTETTTTATDMAPRLDLEHRQVSIGYSLANRRVYVLNYYGNPQPVGVAGELFIGGQSLARGYHGSARRTADRFMPDPFAAIPGARLYRSGDLARFLEDGQLQFIGRMDEQVQLRGFRVEPGEIEALLQEHAQVRMGIVLIHEQSTEEGRPARKSLVACVTTSGPTIGLERLLHNWLASKLPAYMVPSRIVVVESMPLTLSGKVDRKALLARVANTERVSSTCRKPVSEDEKTMSAIWCQVLGLDEVGLDSNYFELGGDSILALQIVSKARAAGLLITPKQLFSHATVASLVAVTKTDKGPLLPAGPVSGEVNLSPIQAGFLGQDRIEAHHYNQAFLFQVPNGLDPARIEWALGQLITHHDQLRARFRLSGEGWTQEIAKPGGPVPFQRFDLTEVAEPELEITRLASKIQSSFELGEAPLIKAAHFSLPCQEARLLLTCHHLVVDAVSWRIILEDLETLFSETGDLPARTTSFQDWTARLVEYAASPQLAQELEHWLSHGTLEANRPDHHPAQNTVGSAASLRVSLDRGLTESLLRHAPRAYRTRMNDLLLTALARAFTDLNGGSQLLLDLEAHGREDLFENLDLSRTVGWFTALYPVLLTLPEHGDTAADIKQIKEQLRLIPNNGIGYGILREMNPSAREKMVALPTAQVLFNYLGQTDGSTGDGQIQIASEPIGPSTSPLARRSHLLEVNAMISEGCLHLDWTYSRNIHNEAEIGKLAASYIKSLETLITHCVSPEAGGWTPSDFPLANLDQVNLDKLLTATGPVKDIYPLSPMQENMLFHVLHSPESEVYFLQLMLRLAGQLNPSALRRAFETLVSRHDILKTSFHYRGLSSPLQVVHVDTNLPWFEADWRGLSRTEKEADLEAFMQKDRDRGFSLETAPIFRISLIQLETESWQLLVSHHHLINDGWSVFNILREVFTLYRKETGEPLPDLPVAAPYRNYIGWLAQVDKAAAKSYWTQLLDGFEAPSLMSYAPISQGVADQEPGHKTYAILSESLTGRLQAFTRKHHLTLNSLAQGAWGLLIGTFTGQLDVVFGSTVSGRPAELTGSADMVGLFINTLPVRLRLDRNRTIVDYLTDLHEQQTGRDRFSATSISEIQKWMGFSHGAELFDALLIFENYPMGTETAGEGLAVEEFHTSESTTYPISLSVIPGDRLSLTLCCARSCFDEQTGQMLMNHFEHFLQAMIVEDQTLASLQLVYGEQAGLLESLNRTEAPLQQPFILPMFEAQVATDPEHTALVVYTASDERHVVSYRELDERANRLANYLVSTGVGPEERVGFFLQRSADTIVSLLAILKAGAAFLPLDTGYPIGRLSYLIQDAEITTLIAKASVLDLLPSQKLTFLNLIVLDEIEGDLNQQDTTPPQTALLADNLAYVIYTSGSTGEPKGVPIHHRALANTIVADMATFDLHPEDRSLHFVSFNFDAGISHLFMTLCAGATVHMACGDPLEIMASLPRILREGELTLAIFPASVLASLPHEAFPHLKTIGVGAEACPPALAKRWLPGRRMFNVYGPTETAITATIGDLRAGDPTPSIGLPIRNLTVYVVDHHLRQVPIGAPGELLIGGLGLSRGYLGTSAITATRFIVNPFCPDSNPVHTRLYRTGDQVRRLEDGRIEFLGRIDRQIKFRGFRIELGEIESALLSHPQVKAGAVLLREDQPGHKQLVGYVQPITDNNLNSEDFKSYLGSKLPVHFVPSTILILDELPLNTSSKINRKALPKPNNVAEGQQAAYQAAETPTQKELALIWAETLGKERVGISDNFYELGGHSLLATQIAGRMEGVFSLSIPLKKIFELPTIAEMATFIDQEKEKEGEHDLYPIGIAPRDQPIPLSPNQEALWTLDQNEGPNTVYNIPNAFRFKGMLDVVNFKRCVATTIDRHESLRTRFELIDGKPCQIIEPCLDFTPNMIDLSGIEAGAREAAAEAILRAESLLTFDLGKVPLLRLSLLRLADDDFLMLVTMHHIISDGWSLGIWVQELCSNYAALASGQGNLLPALSRQYADYAVWQQAQLRDEKRDRLAEFWNGALKDAPTLLTLPTDRPRPPYQTFPGDSLTFHLDGDCVAALRHFCIENKTTLFVALETTFALLLGRYANQDQVCLGTPSAHRKRPETEVLIGFFIQTIVLCNDLSGNPTFRELLARIRGTVLDAFAHDDLPFEQVIKAVKPVRNPSYNPLFQVLFALQNAPMGKLDMPGLQLQPMKAQINTSKFDMTLNMIETESGMSGFLVYNTDLFDRATIERLGTHFISLLKAVLRDPDQPIKDLAIAGELPEKTARISGPSAETFPFVHKAFEQQVLRTPNAKALRHGEAVLSYTQLNHRANFLARFLMDHNIGSEDAVAIFLEPSFDAFTAILATLKAGAAYVPLNPDEPPERLRTMIEDAGCALVLSHRQLLDRLASVEKTVVCLDETFADSQTPTPSNPELQINGAQIAYLLYTSGSTGEAKAVMVPHDQLSQYLANYCRQLDLSAQDDHVLIQALTVDASVSTIYPPLLLGGTLHILSRGESRDGRYLADYMDRYPIHCLKAAPSHLMALANEVAPIRLMPARRLVMGGEAANWSWLRSLAELPVATGMYNQYGPTETTVGASIYPLDSQRLKRDRVTAPIGYPLGDTTMYVLDERLQPVPDGFPGQLYLGGPGLARGYLNRSDLTAKVFIPNPFADARGSRLYASGDLARRLEDGSLEFLGRVDHQVKIRGLRIELGEIEAAINRFPGVQSSVALAVDDTRKNAVSGAKVLLAYVVLHSDEPGLREGELREFLEDHLPKHMMPLAFTELQSLPLTVHGKLNRRALPEPDFSHLSQDRGRVEPRTEKERILTGIWADLLDVEVVGIHDNFFQLGGDSILSIQVSIRARKAGLSLSTRDIFRAQTIAGITKILEQGTAVPVAEQGLISGPVPLTPIQRRFFEQETGARHHFNQSLMVKVPKSLTAEIAVKALQALLEHHDALRFCYRGDGADTVQICAAPGQGESFQLIEIGPAQASDPAAYIEEQAALAQTRFDLGQGPLIRFVLFRCVAGTTAPALEDGNRLLIIVHHLAMDAASWPVLLEDLEMACRQVSQGQTVKLPAKTSSFKEWSQRLSIYARSKEFAAERAWWLEQVVGQSRPLPLDHQVGPEANTFGSTRRLDSVLGEEATHALIHDVPLAFNTRINDALVTALSRALAAWSGNSRPLIALEGHGREHLFEGIDLTRTIGWFTSVFPVCPQLEDETNAPLQDLKNVKELLRAIPNNGIGYGILRYLGSPEDRSALTAGPQPQVTLNYFGRAGGQTSSGDGFEAAAESSGSPIAASYRRPALLDVSGVHRDGQLIFTWTYSEAMHKRATIERLAEAFLNELRDLIEACATCPKRGYTPSDFPLANLDGDALDSLIEGFGELTDIYRLSPLQEGILYHTLRDKDGGMYLSHLACRLYGSLDTELFRLSWQKVLDRNSSLRASFHWENLEQPVQVIPKQVDLPWQALDWRHLSEQETQSRLDALLAKIPELTLTRGPLMNWTLIRLAERKGRPCFQFVWHFHHLIMDGWSLANLLKQVFASYHALANGQVVASSEPHPYRDYISLIAQTDPSAGEHFWKKLLGDFSEPNSLAYLGTQGKRLKEFRNGEQELALSPELSKALHDLAGKQSLTPNTVIQGAWAVLLSFYTRSRDIVYGVTLSGRPPELPGIEDMVGLFINTLPLRTNVAPEMALLPWLRELQEQQLNREQHCALSLAEVQTWSGIAPGLHLFENILVVENYPVDRAMKAGGGEAIEADEITHSERNNYPLALIVGFGSQVSFRAVFDANRFEPSSVRLMLGHLGSLLKRMVANPEQRLGELSLSGGADLQLVAPDRIASENVNQLLIHQRFERQALATPDAVAVSFAGAEFDHVEISYADLDRRANVLARRLRALGVGPDVPVGLLLDRCPEMIVGILAILKAGGGYVPLDPSYPPKRLLFMLEDVAPPILVTRRDLAGELPDIDAHVLLLDDPNAQAKLSSVPLPALSVNPDNLAYVIFTSGSSGKPKGVQISHGNVTRLFSATEPWFGFDDRDVWCLFHSYAFDFSVWEIWGALFYGGRLAIVPFWCSRSPQAFAGFLASEGVTVLNQTPSAFYQLIDAMIDETPSDDLSLRYVIFGGEALDPTRLDPFYGLVGENAPSLINMYGITETTVHVSYHQLVRDGSAASVIGRGIPDLAVYILDEALRPLPAGVPGELFVGGAGLARGYLKRPALTASRFLPNPFSADSGSRLYRSGDLARCDADGVIEYLGRIDAQVQLRGFRVELGEVEDALLAHPTLRQAAVLVREHPSQADQKQLAAFVVAEQGQQTPSSLQLRAFLAESLADYMVPNTITVLDRMPLTPTHKLDRTALTALASDTISKDYVAPRNEVETTVAKVWSEVLGVERVGIYDNFFELGGHSLLMIQAISRLQKAFAVKLEMEEVFRCPSLEDLASFIEKLRDLTAQLQAPTSEIAMDEEEWSI